MTPSVITRAEQEIRYAEQCAPPFTRLADLLRDLLQKVRDLRASRDNEAMDNELPPSLAAELQLFREDPDAWHAEWRRKQEFKVKLIERAEAAEAEVRDLLAYRDRHVALSVELGQILGPGYDGVDLRVVAQEVRDLRANLEQAQSFNNFAEAWDRAKLEAEVRDLRASLQQLKAAITPTHADEWDVAQIATLAEAHRSDSEALDFNER